MSRMFVNANKWSKWWPTLSDCRAEQTGRHRAGNRFSISSSVLSIYLCNIQNIHLASQFRTGLIFNFFLLFSDSAFISFSPQDMVHHTHAPSTLTKYGHLVKRFDTRVVTRRLHWQNETFFGSPPNLEMFSWTHCKPSTWGGKVITLYIHSLSRQTPSPNKFDYNKEKLHRGTSRKVSCKSN